MRLGCNHSLPYRHIDELGLDVDYYTVDTFRGFTDDDIRTEHERDRSVLL